MGDTHKFPTISFRVSPSEKEQIEAKILVSGMQKKDYIKRSCIYNHVCVVGKKELVYKIVEELVTMQLTIKELAEQLAKQETTISREGIVEMYVEYENFLQAVLWMIEGAEYLWKEDKKGGM